MKKGFIIAGVVLVLAFAGSLVFLTMSNKEYLNKNAKLADINYETDKLNIYVFFGSTCPHCEELLNYLDSIRKDFGDMVRIYAFEVWENEENGQIMDKFLSKFGEETGSRSVPFFIIGEEDFSGYSSSDGMEIRETITNQYENLENLDNYKSLLTSE